MKLSDIKTAFDDYLIIKDKWVVDIILATVIGNSLLDRDPIWTMIVAPSSGGKTSILAPCVSLENVTFVDDVTEKSFLSGYKAGGKDPSLLKKIGTNGIMAFSDFTSILAKDPGSRGEILTQFKLIYDGSLSKHTGTGGAEWKGKVGFIGAATPDVYSMLEGARSLGERFAYYWVDQPSDSEIVAKQRTVNISSKEITAVMSVMYLEYCIAVREFRDEHGLPEFSMTEEQRDRIRRAAMFCVNGKATVHTNFKSGKVDQIPNKAGVGRDNKMFDGLLHATQLMDAYEANDPEMVVTDDRIAMVEKCAYSSITRERRKILEILAEHDSAMTPSDIGAQEGLGLEKASVEMYLHPLHAVGLIKKDTSIKNSHRWKISDDETKEFIKKVSKNVRETFQVPGIDLSSEPDDTSTQYSDADAEANAMFNQS